MQGPAFYRPESAQGRDLAVLAAAIHRRTTGQLHVLDVMSGSGVRGARYLQQVIHLGFPLGLVQSGLCAYECICHRLGPTRSGAMISTRRIGRPWSIISALWFQLARISLKVCGTCRCQTLASNLKLIFSGVLETEKWLAMGEETFPPGLKKPVWECKLHRGGHAHASPEGLSISSKPPALNSNSPASTVTVRVSHLDAHRLLSCCALNEEYYDLVDIDSFGSDTSFLGSAIETVRWAH